ncbi:hypothetical protein CMI44_01900 [Candidatus Pacearchaeota archaeon]|nr:hypothetical protein [Candidatus Pacearchaeota archaeon]
MGTKNILVFFLALASVLLSLTVVSAAEIADVYSVEVNGIPALSDEASVTAGETVTVKVYFDALENASDVDIRAEIEGDKVDVEEKDGPFTIESGFSYRKTLTLDVPYELENEVSDDTSLVIKIWNNDHKTEETMILRVQRPTYNAEIMSISLRSQTVEAGDTMPIDVVVKNIGYNNLDDLFVTAQIKDLNVKSTIYFGDIVSFECFDEDDEPCDEDDEDISRGKFFLKIPYDAVSGIYTLEVEAENNDLAVIERKQIVVENDFSAGNAIVASMTQNIAVGQDAEYEVLVVNPTNKLKVYRIVPESSNQLSASTSQAVVAVPAGSSKAVMIKARADAEGIHNFNVNVFSGEELVSTVVLSANVSGTSFTAPVVVLTIVLAIVFLVLLVVLIILLGKKPEKEQEEFGESYY